MKKTANSFLFSLILFVVLCSLQCDPPYDDLNNTAEFAINDWEIKHIDNSGAAPKVITDQEIAPLNAYGIRLTAKCEVFYPEYFDTTSTYAYFTNRNYINNASISTVNDLSPTFPAGSDVSSLFKFRVNTRGNINYYPISGANSVLNYPVFANGSSIFYSDLLLVSPGDAFAGEHQFNIQLSVQDTLLTTLTSPKITLR